MKGVFTVVKSLTLGQQVYEHVRGEILAGELPPGGELNEVAIARDLGVSRGPVREAFGRLGAEGLIQSRPHRGAIVAELSQSEFLDAYELREILEVSAARIATPMVTRETLEQLSAALDTMKAAAAESDENRFFEGNSLFHATIVHSAGNSHLSRFYDSLQDQMGRYQHVSVKLRGDLTTSIEEHRLILEALENGDASRAADLVKAHVQVPQQAIDSMSKHDWGLASQE